MTDTFSRWGEYLEYIDQENKLIEKRNAKHLKKVREDNEREIQAINRINDAIEERNEARRLKYKAELKAYNETPWYRIGHEPKYDIWDGEHTLNTFGMWYVPVLEPLKKPTIEEYLTWKLK